MPSRLEITGMTFGRLGVIGFAHISKHGASCWHCVCVCRKEVTVAGGSLTKGWTKSCGCLSADTASRIWHKHGHTDRSVTGSPTQIYSRWQAMLQRCYNPNHAKYKDYGARGINVSDRWRVFENFLEDMGEPPEGMQLDRIDNDGDYCKENCRWASAKEQMRNRRVTVLVEWRGVRKPLMEWAAEVGIHYRTLHYRLKRGWTAERAFTEVT